MRTAVSIEKHCRLDLAVFKCFKELIANVKILSTTNASQIFVQETKMRAIVIYSILK
jgi:hypothetical protein